MRETEKWMMKNYALPTILVGVSILLIVPVAIGCAILGGNFLIPILMGILIGSASYAWIKYSVINYGGQVDAKLQEELEEINDQITDINSRIIDIPEDERFALRTQKSILGAERDSIMIDIEANNDIRAIFGGR